MRWYGSRGFFEFMMVCAWPSIPSMSAMMGRKMRRDVHGDVDLAVLQRGHAHGVVRNGPEDELLDARRPCCSLASISMRSSLTRRTNFEGP
jgi:hypothetical protein